MGKTYGYCRISRKTQSIDRQIRNIKDQFPDAVMVTEAFTGTKLDRPQWNKLVSKLQAGDTVVFDSVSRMSRNADDGIKVYFELLEKGISLVFLKEHYIDTDIYLNNTQDKIELTGTDEDEIFKGINNYFRKLAVKQIRIAFEQAQKEVDDLHQRTKEGIREVKEKNDRIRLGIESGEIKQIGGVTGKKLTTKKSITAKQQIQKYSKDFDGSLADAEVMKLTGLARNTYYKYKRELRNAQSE